MWSVAYYEDKTHTSPGERAAFDGVVDAGFTDVVRPHTSEPGTFTYWDYKQLRFAKRQGMRIDFALCSEALAQRVVGAAIDRQERKGKGLGPRPRRGRGRLRGQARRRPRVSASRPAMRAATAPPRNTVCT